MADCVNKSFPGDALVPKKETGVSNFLKKYPEYNGDGVTIAIFDSGVDPKAAGLEKLPDGSPKVIERFDCSGCGDVDTSKVVTASPEGVIIGVSGREIKLTPAIIKDNTGNSYNVGLKSLHDLYPSKVRDKLNSDFKQKHWDEKQKLAVAQVARALDEFDNKNGSQNLALNEKLKKDDLDNSLECLQSYEKQISDIKTAYDCILYPTKNGWKAVIDVDNGNLDKAIVLGEYSLTHEVASIDGFLTISINVHDEGNVLEIVGVCSSHGTHVSSIAAGNHSHNGHQELDGVAPGAKLISLCIGDGRLGSMETGTSITRAISKVMELCKAGKRVHAINMSYGEFTHWSNTGRIIELMNEAVNDYGIVWVASAGNHGPALYTIGTPPDINQLSCVAVGAYVSPEMMEAEYSLREKLPANVYTWTSRDPCTDGGQAVTVCAPGAAIASVPEYTLNKQQLMNGTSMSSPHVCGAVALLISGLLKNDIPYSPFSIKRALWNSATHISYVDKFAQGNGLLNVEKAYEHLAANHECLERDIRFNIKVGPQNAKGINLRKGILTKPEEFAVTIQPVFANELECAAKNKINFNLRLTLLPSESWVQCGSFLDLCYSERSIIVKVDPTGLPPGVHTARIRAFDSANVNKGTVFEVPITVIQPIELDAKSNYRLDLEPVLTKPNTILRNFIVVPRHATWAVLKLRSDDVKKSTQSKFLVHTMQILPHKYCKSLETQKILPVSTENETVHYFRVQENNILEVCIAKFWSNFGETNLRYSIEFHGIHVHNSNTMMHGASGVHRIDLTTLNPEDASPSIQLRSAVMVIKPTESKILPLTQRDVIPQGRQVYQNLVTYNLQLSKAQEVSFAVPLVTNVLYESEFDSQFWMCFDANKALVASGDAYSATNFTKLNSGEYVIRLQVRHEKKELLEKVNEATLLATFKLASPVSLDVYSSYRGALLNEKKLSSCSIAGRHTVPIYVAPLSNDKLSKAGYPTHCSWLQGTFSIAKDEQAKKVDNHSFDYFLPEGPAVKKPNGNSKKTNGKETKNKLDEYKEGLRDFQNGQIGKLDLTDAEELYTSIIKDFPTYLTAHISLIQKLELAETKNSLPFTYVQSLKKASDLDTTRVTLGRIIDLANVVIKETNIESLLSFYGLKTDNRPDAAKIKTEMDKQKATLLDAYVRKAIALGKLGLIEKSETKKESFAVFDLNEFNDIYVDVGRFIEYTDTKVIYVALWHAFVNEHYGRMTKILQKLYEDKYQREVLEELLLVVKEKKWDHVSCLIQKLIISANPTGYRPF